MWQEVLGVVANLISVDQSYENAVEAILGGQLQSLPQNAHSPRKPPPRCGKLSDSSRRQGAAPAQQVELL